MRSNASSWDRDSPPTEEDVLDYARYLGIDVEVEPHLLWIARQGLDAPLPAPWKAHTEGEGEYAEVFYFNPEEFSTTWDHPADKYFRDLLEQQRALDPEGAGQDMAANMSTDDVRLGLRTGQRPPAATGEERGASMMAPAAGCALGCARGAAPVVEGPAPGQRGGAGLTPPPATRCERALSSLFADARRACVAGGCPLDEMTAMSSDAPSLATVQAERGCPQSQGAQSHPTLVESPAVSASPDMETSTKAPSPTTAEAARGYPPSQVSLASQVSLTSSDPPLLRVTQEDKVCAQSPPTPRQSVAVEGLEVSASLSLCSEAPRGPRASGATALAPSAKPRPLSAGRLAHGSLGTGSESVGGERGEEGAPSLLSKRAWDGLYADLHALGSILDGMKDVTTRQREYLHLFDVGK